MQVSISILLKGRPHISLFYYFIHLKMNLDLLKTNQLGESLPDFILAVVNLY